MTDDTDPPGDRFEGPEVRFREAFTTGPQPRLQALPPPTEYVDCRGPLEQSALMSAMREAMAGRLDLAASDLDIAVRDAVALAERQGARLLTARQFQAVSYALGMWLIDRGGEHPVTRATVMGIYFDEDVVPGGR